MKKYHQTLLNVVVLVLMILNPLASFAPRAVDAQAIVSEKTSTMDVTASHYWSGGPDEKPDLWLMLNQEAAGAVSPVSSVLPKMLDSGSGSVTWSGLPKYTASGERISYSADLGVWDALSQSFLSETPKGYSTYWNSDGLTSMSSFIDLEPIKPVETEEPTQVPDPTEPPSTGEEPIVPSPETTEPVEPALETPVPTEPPAETPDPIQPPVLTPEPTEPVFETPNPTEPPVVTPEPTEPPLETPQPGSVTAVIHWQGGTLPRPAFWLKLQQTDASGVKSDVSDVELIQANFAAQVTWANFDSYSADLSYTIAVVDELGNDYSIPGYTSQVNGLELTNIWQQQNTMDVVASVEWLKSLDPKEALNWSEFEMTAPTVWLRLYRQSGAGEVPVALLSTELKEMADGATTAVWSDMPTSDSRGVDYIYSVKQVDANGASFTPAPFSKVEKGLLVQNIGIPGSGTRDIIDPPSATHTYIFTVDGVEVDRQIVKNGDLLLEPAAPVKADHKFTGWYVDGTKIDFSQPVAVTSTETKTAVAQFTKVYYVFFMDGVGADARVFVTKEGTTGASVSTSDFNLPIASNQAVTGWYLNSGLTGSPVSDPYIIGTANQQLWPKIEVGNYVYFVSGPGATYIKPQFVPPTGVTVAPATPPTRPGYNFSHWSTTEGGTAYTFGNPITTDVTLHAVWTAKTNTSYTVVFWKQSVKDSKTAADSAKTYDYAESEIRTAATGATVSPTTADGSKNYQGFHYNSAKSVAVVVKGDGSTVLNVYYDRNLLTIDFHSNNKPGAEDGNYTGLYGQTLAQNGYTWPSSHKWTQNASSWNPGQTLTFLDAFLFDTLSAYGSTTYINLYAQTLSGTAQIIHYKENLDGTWSVANTITTSGGTFYFSNKYNGFTVYQYRADNGNWLPAVPDGSASYSNKLEVRHQRNSYNLAFYNYNITSRTETLKFESPLAAFASYVPPKPSALPPVYEFQGWFKDTAFSVPFNFATETMPASSVMVYAKWAPPVVNGIVYLNVQGTEGPITLPLTYGQPINPAILPTVKDHLGNIIQQGDDSLSPVIVPENHKWLGWATKEGDSFVNFNFNTIIHSNITLYPYYVNNASFSLTYNAGEGSGTPPVDAKNYADGAYADVLPPTGLTAPAGKVFLGWENGGKLYQPGDKIRITGNMTLTAQWGDVKDKTKVTYQPGVGSSDSPQTFENLIVNGTITLIQNPFTAKDGYTFTGWKNMTNGQIYQPGATLQVDGNLEDTHNILIAQWNKSFVADKIWEGGPKPAVWFQLLQNGSAYLAPVKLDGTPDPSCGDGPCGYEDQAWKAKWNGLPAQDSNNNPINYTFVEGHYVNGVWTPGAPANYTAVYGASNDKVTNIYTIPTGPFSATKVWEGDTTVTRPTLTFTLWRKIGTTVDEIVPGAEVKEVNGTVTVADWTGLQLTDSDGNPYTFYVKEAFKTTSPENANWELGTYDFANKSITNTVKSCSAKLTVTKVFVNEVQPQPFGITANDPLEFEFTVTGPYNFSQTFTLKAGESKEFTGLYCGEYTVTETNAHGYTPSYNPANGKVTFTTANEEKTVTVTNTANVDTLVAKTVTKVWENGPKPNVVIELWRKGVKVDGTTFDEKVGEFTATATVTTHTFEGLAKHDPSGREFEYYAKEPTAPANYTKVENGLTVTNTYVIPTGPFSATKVWEGDTTVTRPTLTFTLWRKTATVDQPVPGAEVKEVNGTVTVADWTGLELTDSDGNPYTFYVKEAFADPSDPTNANWKFGEYDFVNNKITNSVESCNGTLTIKKELYNDLVPTRQKAIISANNPLEFGFTVTGPYNFSQTFTLKAGESKEYTELYCGEYTVTETVTHGYEPHYDPAGGKVTITKDGPNQTVTVYNWPTTATRIDKTVTKEWVGGPSEKPAITIELWRKGFETDDTPIDEYVGSINLPVGTAWSHTFTGLAKHDPSGREFEYYVVEPYEPDNYEATYDQKNLKVTNSYVPPTAGTATATKEWKPDGLLDSLKVTVWFKLYRQIEGGALEEVPETEAPIKVLPVGTLSVTWENLTETDNNGNPYTFSVKEVNASGEDWKPENYSKTEDGLKVTNTYHSPMTTADSYKVWSPSGLLDSLKFNVTFQLWRYIGSDSSTATLVEPEMNTVLDGTVDAPCDSPCGYEIEPWQARWIGIPETDINGNVYHYVVKETSALNPGFSKSGELTDTVTNHYDNMDDDVTEDVVATKTWMPEGLLDSMKFPVTYQLYRYTTDPALAETVGEPVTLNAPSWSYTWADMPTTDTVGNPYTYYVIETNTLPDGFSKVEDGLNVTNTYDNMDDAVTEDLKATKIWMPVDLLDTLKVPVNFQLYRYTTDPDTPEAVGDPVELNAEGGWVYTWTDMPTTDTVGNPYTYYVEETVTPAGFEKTEEGMTVTNTYQVPSDAIVAEKVWVGGSTPRPTVWFQLWRTWTRAGTTHHEPVPEAEIKALPDGTLSVFWTDIETETIIGIPYTFYVKEVDADGNDWTPTDYTKVEAGLKVTNSYVPPTMLDPLYMNKIWAGGKAPYPAIYFHLYRNVAGGALEAVGAPVKLDGVADGGCSSFCEIAPWQVAVLDLPLTDGDGRPYIYTVKETDAAGNDYTPENYVKSYAGLTVTNTYVSPKFDVTATKVWKGGSGVRPTIKVQLYRNGVAFGVPVELVHPNTTYTWTGLDKTDANGVDYNYTVDEVSVPADYSKSVVGLTITNTYVGGGKPPDVPYTGDANNALLYGVLAISSLAGFGAVAVTKRRKKN